MKWWILLWCACCSLISAPRCWAQQSTLSIPITLPPPAPLTATVSQRVTIGAVTYLVTGILTLTPVTTGADVPPPSGTLTFDGYRDRLRNPVATVAAGEPLLIEGTGFGQAGATVTVSGVTVPVTTQTDKEITTTAPNVPGAALVVVNGASDPFPLTITPQTVRLPGAAPGDLPPRDWPPVVTDFRDALGAHRDTLAAGETVRLAGSGFGDAGGVVWLGNEPLPVAAWTEPEITLTLPVTLPVVEHATVWTIQRSGGALSTTFGPPIRGAG